MSKATDALTIAQAEIGKPYSYGAEGPGAFDCSGLVQWVFAHVGITLPRTAAAQQAATTPVTSPRPGDLVFWGRPATHVGIVVGPGRMIAAPHTGARVQLEAIYGTPSGYGRVPGAGIASTLAGGVTGATPALFADGGFTSAIVSGTRDVAILATLTLLGIGLVGAGIYRTFGSQIRKQAKEVLQ